jgi:tetratricopeptide (TPR) repeat protein
MAKNDASYRFCLARAYQDDGQHLEAIKAYTDAIELRPDYAKAYYNRAEAYRQSGNVKKAIADAEKAITIRPEYDEAYGMLGTIYVGHGQYERAIEVLTRAESLDAEDPAYPFLLGFAQNELKNIDEALLSFDRCLRVAPSKWKHCDDAAKRRTAIEADVRTFARDSAIVGFGRDASSDPARATRARTLAVKRFGLLISRWRDAARSGSEGDRAHVFDQVRTLLEDKRLAQIPESDAFAGLPRKDQDHWLSVWHALQELESEK